MIYIITEDSNSGYEFWQNLSILFKVNMVQVLPSSGIANVKNTLKSLLKGVSYTLNHGDKIFLAIDNVSFNSEAYIYTYRLREYVKSILKNLISSDIRICFSSYYCYEEILLSFYKLVNLSSAPDIRELFSKIHDNIMQYKDFSVKYLIIHTRKELNI